MNELTVFNYGESPIRTMQQNGEIWWVLADVCKVLGIKNSRKAATQLDEDEKNTVTFSDGIPGNPNKTIINEPGLYSLILRSNKPEAKAFKRWVTHEVLPTIRKTGSYGNEKMEIASWYYRDMNEACRKKRIAGSSYEQYIKDCTSALDKWEIKDDVITYRGIGRKSTFAGEMLHIPQSEFERMVKDGSIAGQKFTDLGFSSTGVTTGAGWTKEVVMECFVPKGTKAMYVDPVSAHPGEKELLFQRGTEFEIVKAEDHGRYIKLFTKVIGQSH